jgi:hypothetical protein
MNEWKQLFTFLTSCISSSRKSPFIVNKFFECFNDLSRMKCIQTLILCGIAWSLSSIRQPDSSVGMETSCRSAVLFQTGQNDIPFLQLAWVMPRGLTSLSSNGHWQRFALGQVGRVVNLPTHLHSAPSSRMVQLCLHSPQGFILCCLIASTQRQINFVLLQNRARPPFCAVGCSGIYI